MDREKGRLQEEGEEEENNAATAVYIQVNEKRNP